MPISCAAFNCTNRFQKGNGISFHRFPFSKPDLIEQWLINIRREGWKPSKYSHICSDHFDDDCYIGGPHRRRVLKPDAVPTKFNFTLTGHHRFSSKSLCQQFPECLIVVKEGEDNDNLYNPPEEHNISPEEDRKVIIPEDCSEEQKLNNVIDSTKPLDNRIFQVQEEELILPDQLKEQKLSRIDNSSKLPENGIFQIKEQESILPDQSEEQKLSRIDNLSENGIFQVQEQESILPDQSEQKLSSIDDSSKFLENGIFRMQEEESILPDQSEEEKLSSIGDSKLSENGIFQMQKQESVVEDIYDQKWKMGHSKAIAVPETSMQIFTVQEQILPHHSNLDCNKRFQVSDVDLRASYIGDGKFRIQSSSGHKDVNHVSSNQCDSSARNAHIPSAQKRVISSENEHQLRIKLLKNRILQENELHEMKITEEMLQHKLNLTMQMKLHKLLVKHQNILHQINIEQMKNSIND